jgi:hypothetical protein
LPFVACRRELSSQSSSSRDSAAAPPAFAGGTFNVNTVKAGVNYRFGWGAAPVTARH